MPDATPLSPDPEIPPTYANCHKTASELPKSLSKCAKCTTRYCSVVCQTNDWTNNNHKARCAPRKKSPKPATTPRVVPASTFLGLGNDHYLHTRSERDVFGQLIDCFRAARRRRGRLRRGSGRDLRRAGSAAGVYGVFGLDGGAGEAAAELVGR
jgi:hypothetical protein